VVKAIVRERYGSYDAVRFRDVDPPDLGPRDVLVRARAAGVDRGVWHLLHGQPYLVRPAFGLRRPRQPVLGSDVAGVVEAVGAEVGRFRPGDEVLGIGRGSWAELVACPEHKLVPRPTGLDDAEAAVLAISGLTALQAVRDRARVQPGQRVLVLGASGGVGTFAVQVARDAGAEVTGVCRTDKLDLVRGLGATEVLDHTREDATARTGRYDAILDIGGALPLARLRRALTPTGTLVLIGAEGGGRWIGTLDRPLRAVLWSPLLRQRLGALVSSEDQADLAALTTLVASGRVTPVVDRTFPLADAAAALRHLGDGHARGKLALTV
jgi:NADPH:quinone reductase-like Zn-dependent oxidoreductase